MIRAVYERNVQSYHPHRTRDAQNPKSRIIVHPNELCGMRKYHFERPFHPSPRSFASALYVGGNYRRLAEWSDAGQSVSFRCICANCTVHAGIQVPGLVPTLGKGLESFWLAISRRIELAAVKSQQLYRLLTVRNSGI